VLGISEKGHDYYLQMTDARADTGGLSGATPAEAVSWGKVTPTSCRHGGVRYLDNTVGFPILPPTRSPNGRSGGLKPCTTVARR